MIRIPLRAALALAALGALSAPGTAIAQSPGMTSDATSASGESTAVASSPEARPQAVLPATQAAIPAELPSELFLQALREREAELARREQALANEHEAMNAVKAEIEMRIAELQAIRDDIGERLVVLDREREARITSLAGWYGGMEPATAAEQLSTQDVDTIVDVLTAMDERKASAVVESFAVDAASRVIEEMSRRN